MCILILCIANALLIMFNKVIAESFILIYHVPLANCSLHYPILWTPMMCMMAHIVLIKVNKVYKYSIGVIIIIFVIIFAVFSGFSISISIIITMIIVIIIIIFDVLY